MGTKEASPQRCVIPAIAHLPGQGSATRPWTFLPGSRRQLLSMFSLFAKGHTGCARHEEMRGAQRWDQGREQLQPP